MAVGETLRQNGLVIGEAEPWIVDDLDVQATGKRIPITFEGKTMQLYVKEGSSQPVMHITVQTEDFRSGLLSAVKPQLSERVYGVLSQSLIVPTPKA